MNVKLTATLLCSTLFLGACANNMSTNDLLSLGTSGVQALTLTDGQLRDTANQSCAQMDKANNMAPANSKYGHGALCAQRQRPWPLWQRPPTPWWLPTGKSLSKKCLLVPSRPCPYHM